MARVALVVMAVSVWIGLAKNAYVVPDALTDHLWLVAMFPAVYILGISLLRE